VEQSCKFKEDPLMTKATLEIEAGDGATRILNESIERNREGVACAEATTQGRT